MSSHVSLRSQVAAEPDAVIDADGSVRFGADPAARAGGRKFPLLDQGVIAVAGDDARAFLHGQIITDVRALGPTRAPLSAWCNPQGRVLFLFRLLEHAGRFLLIVPRADVPPLIKRLRMYVLRAKVTVEDASDSLALVGLVPEPGIGWLAAETLPEIAGACATIEGLVAIRLETVAPRHVLLGSTTDMAAAWARCVLPAAGTAAWRALDVGDGLPVLPTGLGGSFLPQQLNLDWLGAMSFSKGCYPGQEIIARVKYRGQIKQRLLCGCAEPALAPGTPLVHADRASGNAGQILACAATADGAHAVLAVADVSALAAGAALNTPAGIPVTLARPPYWRDDA